VADEARAEWVARLRELARRDADELVPRPPFEVFGLTEPELRPGVLADVVRQDDVWHAIALAYGDWAAPSGPWVVVTTGSGDPGTEADLLRAMDMERNRLADQAGLDEDDPAEPPRYWQDSLRAGDREAAALAGRHGHLVALSSRLDEVSVTVVSRGVPPGAIRLAAVSDLAPYRLGRDEMIGRVAEHRRQLPAPVLAPAQGMAAYRALVDAELDSHGRLMTAARENRVARRHAAEAATRGALWRRAVAELADRSGIGRRAADDLVTEVVNHLTSLDEKVPWFTASPPLRERAIDETLRYAVLGEQVASSEAQRAWTGYWRLSHSMSVQAASPEIRPAAELGVEMTETRWLDAWAEWARHA
jgi:hypothetical protein